MVGANDVAVSKKFYDAVFEVIGVPAANIDPKGRAWWRTPAGTFGITKPIDGKPASHANGKTTEMVDAWHAAGIANGGTTAEDPPGWRQGAAGKLYLAYLRDPAGNKICALHRG